MIAEEFRIGGTCVIRGCVPKKLYVYASRFADFFADARGLRLAPPRTSRIPTGRNLSPPRDAVSPAFPASMRPISLKAGVDVFQERAEILGPHRGAADAVRPRGFRRGIFWWRPAPPGVSPPFPASNMRSARTRFSTCRNSRKSSRWSAAAISRRQNLRAYPPGWYSYVDPAVLALYNVLRWASMKRLRRGCRDALAEAEVDQLLRRAA